MKVLCVSFSIKDMKIDRENIIDGFLKDSACEDVDVVILPGNFVGAGKKSTGKKNSADHLWAYKLSNKYNAHIIAEKSGNSIRNTFGHFFNGECKYTTPQNFVNSSCVKQKPGLCLKLLEDINEGKRTFNIKGKRFGILICGENNLLRNRQFKGNAVNWRCGKPSKTWCDILINPSHTSMGNWGKLNKRFEFLSGIYNHFIYLTNCHYNGFGTSSFRYYRDGNLVNCGKKPDICSENKGAIGCFLEIE